MMEVETIARLRPAVAKRPPTKRSPWPPWVDLTLADWRKRWPAVFTKPVPLVVGFSRHIRDALLAEGNTVDRKVVGVTIHQWTMQGAYLHAVMRGEMRRNLDGSEAGIPDSEARQHAKRLLDERASRRAERERKERERKATREQSPA